jgi:hypothetical protein
LALSYQHPSRGWLIFPPLSDPVNLLSGPEAAALAADLESDNLSAWEIAIVPENEQGIHWYLTGTIPDDNPPLTLVLALETGDRSQAAMIGQTVLQAAGVETR